MRKIISALQSQGCTGVQVRLDKLIDAGIVIDDGKARPRNVTALLIACAAPDGVDVASFVLETANAHDESGLLFAEALEKILSGDGTNTNVASLSICQNFPWVRIKSLDGNTQEFAPDEFKRCAVRTDYVIIGGLVGHMCMKLNGPVTKSGWVGCEGEE